MHTPPTPRTANFDLTTAYLCGSTTASLVPRFVFTIISMYYPA